MSDTKKNSIIEYTALIASALLTLLFSGAYRYDRLLICLIPIFFNALCVFSCAVITKRQTGKTEKNAVRYGIILSTIYIVVLITAIAVLQITGKLFLPPYAASDICFYCITALSMLFVLAVHSSWRKAYRKMMNKRPLPLIPLLSVFIAVGLAMLPVNIIKEVIPLPPKYNLPVPYTDGFSPTPPEISENAVRYYVSEKDGDDENSGLSENEALKTVGAAKLLIRQTELPEYGAVIYIASGNYDQNSFIFSEADSGTENCNIVYIAEKGVSSNDDTFNINFTENVSYITLYGLELTQNSAISIDGNYITLCGCSFNGCSVTVNGNNNIISGNDFSMTNSAALTDKGIANNIIYNYFHDIKVITDGALIINGFDTEICGNCFDKITERSACACIYISDTALGIKIDGNLLLNIPGNAVSHADKENIFNSFSGNFILNCDTPVIKNRNGAKTTLKFNNNILITSERADNYPLNAVYTYDKINDIFTDPENGVYKLKNDTVVSEAFPMIKDIILFDIHEKEPVPPEIITFPEIDTTDTDENTEKEDNDPTETTATDEEMLTTEPVTEPITEDTYG